MCFFSFNVCCFLYSCAHFDIPDESDYNFVSFFELYNFHNENKLKLSSIEYRNSFPVRLFKNEHRKLMGVRVRFLHSKVFKIQREPSSGKRKIINFGKKNDATRYWIIIILFFVTFNLLPVASQTQTITTFISFILGVPTVQLNLKQGKSSKSEKKDWRVRLNY